MDNVLDALKATSEALTACTMALNDNGLDAERKARVVGACGALMAAHSSLMAAAYPMQGAVMAAAEQAGARSEQDRSKPEQVGEEVDNA